MPLLLIPLLGGLLWWLLKGGGAATSGAAAGTAAAGTVAGAPAGAVPTGAAAGTEPAGTAAGTDPGVAAGTIPAGTAADTAAGAAAGTVPAGVVAAGVAAAGAAAAGAAATLAGAGAAPAASPRMILTPRDAQNAYAYWEIPPETLAEAKRQGGDTMMLRLYDVTGRDDDSPLPAPTAEFPCIESNPDLHLPIAMGDRKYCAEIGYVGQDNQWLPIAKSAPVQMPATPDEPLAASIAAPGTETPATPVSTTDNERTGTGGLGSVALGGAALAGAAALGAAKLAGKADDSAAPIEPGSIVLTPRSAQDADAHWEVSESAKSALKANGGEAYQLRIYDVTDTEVAGTEVVGTGVVGTEVAGTDGQLTNNPSIYNLSEAECDRTVSLPNAQHTYKAEVGYQTTTGSWLSLARSTPTQPAALLSQLQKADELATPVSDTSSAAATVIPAAAVVGGLAAGVAAIDQGTASADGADVADTGEDLSAKGTTQTVKVHSRSNAVMFNEGQLHHLEHTVASTYQLIPGLYTLRLRDGVFNYDADDNHPGEPFVILWIHGGTVINQKTNVPVSSTWTTLNGYDDTLILDVREPATLCAFFVDTYPDDNSGEVTLTVTKQ